MGFLCFYSESLICSSYAVAFRYCLWADVMRSYRLVVTFVL